MVKNLPSNAGDAGLIPGRGAKRESLVALCYVSCWFLRETSQSCGWICLPVDAHGLLGEGAGFR